MGYEMIFDPIKNNPLRLGLLDLMQIKGNWIICWQNHCCINKIPQLILLEDR